MSALSSSLNLNATAALRTYNSQNSTRVSQFSLTYQATSAYAAVGTDTATISDQARGMANKSYAESVFFTLFGINTETRSTSSSVTGLLDLMGVGSTAAAGASGQYQSLAQVGQSFADDFGSLTGILGGMFSRMGLGGESFSMRLDGRGGVVSDDTSDAAQSATKAVNGNSTLVARFAVMAARAAITDAASTVDGFQSAYNADPAAAIQQFVDDLKDRLLGFNLGYGEDGFNATVQGNDVTPAK